MNDVSQSHESHNGWIPVAGVRNGSEWAGTAGPLAVVIPALDEEPVIAEVVGRVRRHLRPGVDRVIVVDNGSIDTTAARAVAAGADVVAEPRRGYGRACRAGVEAAAGAEVVILMDGDGADDPGLIPSIAGPVLRDAADLVVGVREPSRREPGSMTVLQSFGNRLVAAAIHALVGSPVADIGPLRAIRRQRLLDLDMSEMTYGWSTEMTVKALRVGYRYLELPVPYARRVGRSKVSGDLVASIRAGARILATVVRYRGWQPARDPT
jgi:glycosyltransferase involved in cell wall biosynthesis